MSIIRTPDDLQACLTSQVLSTNTIAGIDEVGRGPLAGPVVAACVLLPDDHRNKQLADSKILSPAKRETLAKLIQSYALGIGIGEASVAEIDTLNIHHATLLAMSRAYAQMGLEATFCLVDGKYIPTLPIPAAAVIKGDGWVEVIAAASIIAKVHRDAMMCDYDARYPGYGLAVHKGYPTKAHLQAIEAHGVLPIHRKSYAPIKRLLTT